jgi:hypothetical protein
MWYFPTEVNCAKVWAELNDCNVFDATKLLLIANLLSSAATPGETGAGTLVRHYDATSSQRLSDFIGRLPGVQQKQLRSIGFLGDTVVDDIHMLLLCDADAAEDGAPARSAGEVVAKAKALAALSVTMPPLAPDAPTASTSSAESTGAAEGVRRLLQVYLSAAEARVQEILDAQLQIAGQQGESTSTAVCDSVKNAPPVHMVNIIDY